MGGNRLDLGFPAIAVVALVEVVEMSRSRNLVLRVRRYVVEPLGEIVGVREAGNHNHIVSALVSNRVD